jgi:hypothetical protein
MVARRIFSHRLIKADYPNDIVCRKADFHESEYALEYKEIGGV